jgi:hypothetical protein
MKRIFLLIVVPALLVALGFAQTPAASGNTDQVNMKGCLGGSDGNYTVADDNSGKIFRITTSSADLKPHVGHDVNLIGHKTDNAGNGLTITEMSMISEHCTAASAGPPANVSTPAETASTPPAAAASPAPVASAAAPDATVSTPSETAIAPPAVAAAPAPAADATVSTPSETAIAPPAVAAAPAPAADATVSSPSETAIAPAQTASAPPAAAPVHRTGPSARPRKSSATPAAAAAEPVTPVADAAVPTAAVPTAPASSASDAASTPAEPAPAATKPTTSRSIWMLVSIVVVVILIGGLVPLYQRWRRQKLLEETRAQNLSFTKDAKTDPGTTAGPKAA